MFKEKAIHYTPLFLSENNEYAFSAESEDCTQHKAKLIRIDQEITELKKS